MKTVGNLSLGVLRKPVADLLEILIDLGGLRGRFHSFRLGELGGEHVADAGFVGVAERWRRRLRQGGIAKNENCENAEGVHRWVMDV